MYKYIVWCKKIIPICKKCRQLTFSLHHVHIHINYTSIYLNAYFHIRNAHSTQVHGENMNPTWESESISTSDFVANYTESPTWRRPNSKRLRRHPLIDSVIQFFVIGSARCFSRTYKKIIKYVGRPSSTVQTIQSDAGGYRVAQSSESEQGTKTVCRRRITVSGVLISCFQLSVGKGKVGDCHMGWMLEGI